MNKIVLIIDESEAFLRNEVLRISEEWEQQSIQHMTTWDAVKASSPRSLLAPRKMTHLDLTDKKDLKSFVDVLDNNKKTEMFKKSNWYGVGLIITATVAQGTKKIENLVKDNSGQVIKKEKPEIMATKLLERIHVAKSVKKEIMDYVGTDYDMLISPVNEIEKMEEAEQKKITFEEFLIMLPNRPGGILPWEFINPMMDGNADKAIIDFERMLKSSHVLVAMTFARRKIESVFRLKMLQVNGIRDSKKQAEVLGETNSPALWYTSKISSKLSLETIKYLVNITYKLEHNIKGGLAVNANDLFKTYIGQVCTAIKTNRPLR